ncbi:MAG: ATP-dependent dethiobiotin synthetase BioD [Neisseriaceae bacterium]|nr:MAG: ATP-dependent dethiobiotin synthetase BioD [Neisseriaceae bacterium]
MQHGIYFITGIDTNIGKTIATGLIAKNLLFSGQNVITQKLVQTGNQKFSEDVLTHRKLMNIPLQPVDLSKTTMPEIYSYPASPHLAAKIDKRPINFEKLNSATKKLKQEYDIVLIEGAGGIMVPFTEDYLTLDYIKKNQYPIILVTNGKLGSLNHTLLNLHLFQTENISLYAIAYNHHSSNTNSVIENDTIQYLQRYLSKYFPNTTWIDIPNYESINI